MPTTAHTIGYWPAPPPLHVAQNLPIPQLTEQPTQGFYLSYLDEALYLSRWNTPAKDGICLDFMGKKIMRRLKSGRRSLLAKSFGLHRKKTVLSVLDLTCGLGSDSATLAHLDCQVTALEKQPALAALLLDALQRLSAQNPALAQKLNIIWADAYSWLADTQAQWDVVYLDPMFDSPRRKAQPKLGMQWLHDIAGIDDNVPRLLNLARQHARQRVVMKRHARMQPLVKPDLSFTGKSVCFDIYLT